MKLRESREEIARLKEELEASELASREREQETAGKAAEQIEREQEASRGERARVLEQLESAEADRDKVANQLEKAEERQQQERERHQTRTRALVVGSMVLAGLIVALVVGAGDDTADIVAVTTTSPTSTVVVTTTSELAKQDVVTTSTVTPSTVVVTTVPSVTTSEPVRATTSLVPSTTTTIMETKLPVDPSEEEPPPPIDEAAVLTDNYEWWETSERVQVLQIVLGMDADWTYGPSTYDRHLQGLIERQIDLSYLPVPPTSTVAPTTTIVTTEMLLPDTQVQDFKHPGLSDEWIFFGTAGTSVQIQMTSSHFDTYLEVLGPLGNTVAGNDDHFGTNSFVSVQLCETGTYKIFAGSFGFGNLQTGQYTILLSGGKVIFDALLQKCEDLKAAAS